MLDELRRNWLIYAILAGVCAFASWAYFSRPTPGYVSVPGPVQYVPVPKTVTKIKEVTVPGPERVVLIPGAATALKMPELTHDNVLAVGEIKPHTGKTTVVAVANFDNDAMRVTLKSRQEPPPFFELKRDFRVGAYIGTGQSFRGMAAFSPLRVGPVDVVLLGDVQLLDSKTEVRAWGGAEMRF